MKFKRENVFLTFQDVLLKPHYSEILPNEACIETQVTQKLKISLPIISSAMDTVTESKMATAMAVHGGLGVIHKNMSPDSQALEVEKVKKTLDCYHSKDAFVFESSKVKDAVRKLDSLKLDFIFVIDSEKRPIGFLTIDMLQRHGSDTILAKVDYNINFSSISENDCLDEIIRLSKESKHLAFISEKGTFLSLFDREVFLKIPLDKNSSLDKSKQLMVGAAIGTEAQALERAEILHNSKVDLLVIDTAHGHSKRVIETLKALKKKFPETSIIAGNVATSEAAIALIKNGTDCVKVGIGPGSICTTRSVTGVGVPQLDAIFDTARACRKYGIPLIADGGIQSSGDVVKALAAGASSVMLGSLLSGTDEAPGEVVTIDGKKYKAYRGMGSRNAMMEGSKDRYNQGHIKEDKKLVPEGIEALNSYKGSVSSILFQLSGGLRSGMGYLGAKNLDEIQKNAEFIRISPQAYRESQTHSIALEKRNDS
jgi:IMP dehydrogenase